MERVFQKFVKPQPDLLVRDPSNMHRIPEEGCWVDWTGPRGRYFRRRVKDQSLIICDPPKKQLSFNNDKKKENK